MAQSRGSKTSLSTHDMEMMRFSKARRNRETVPRRKNSSCAFSTTSKSVRLPSTLCFSQCMKCSMHTERTAKMANANATTHESASTNDLPPAIAVAGDARGRAKGETRTDPAPRALEAAGGPRARARLLGRRHAESPSFLFLRTRSRDRPDRQASLFGSRVADAVPETSRVARRRPFPRVLSDQSAGGHDSSAGWDVPTSTPRAFRPPRSSPPRVPPGARRWGSRRSAPA